MKRVVLLGSTGSIGTSTLKVAEELPEEIRLIGLAAGNNGELLLKQTLKHRPDAISIREPGRARELENTLGTSTRVYAGAEGLLKLATLPAADIVLIAIVGTAGLQPALAAIRAGKDIAVGTMGAVGALVGGGTGQILSAGVAATTATGIAVDKTFFYNSTMPSMITAMNAGRAKLLTDITIGMQKAYKDYPISTAFADLDAYYYAGTLQGAQANIQTTSGNTIQKEAANKANAPAIAKGNPEAVQNFKASRQ